MSRTAPAYTSSTTGALSLHVTEAGTPTDIFVITTSLSSTAAVVNSPLITVTTTNFELDVLNLTYPLPPLGSCCTISPVEKFLSDVMVILHSPDTPPGECESGTAAAL